MVIMETMKIRCGGKTRPAETEVSKSHNKEGL